MKLKEIFKDIFHLLVRLLGLFFFYHGLSSLPTVMQLFLTKSLGNYVIGFILILWPLAVGCWLIGGAPQVMDRAYPEAKKEGGETGAAVKTDPKL
jgi:hypothetical protein